MQIKAIKTRIFHENEDLFSFIFKYVKKIPEKSVLVVTSKVVSLAEGRTIEYKNKKQKVELIKKESSLAINTKLVWLTIKDGIVMADAGIDESNGDGQLIFLPKKSFFSAKKIRALLCAKYKVKNLGVIISDSGLVAFRSGVIGLALGYAGFKGVKSYKGKKDIFGRKFIYQKVNVADSLATAATLCMGEGNERQPLVLVKNAPVIFTAKTNKKEINFKKKEDIYAPLFNKIN